LLPLPATVTLGAVNYLLRLRAGVQHTISAPPAPDAATTMEKLDAALNSMSHGPSVHCLFVF